MLIYKSLRNQLINLTQQLKLLLLCLCCLLSYTVQAAQMAPYSLTQADQPFVFHTPLYYQLSPKQYKLENFLYQPHQWQISHQSNRVFDLTNQALWSTSSVINKTEKPINTVLYFDSALVNQIQLYAIDNDNNRQILAFTGGSNFSYQSRLLPYRNYAVPITLEPQQQLNFYLRVSHSYGLKIKWGLSPLNTYTEQQLYHSGNHSSFAGALIALALFNLLAYLSLRERLYLYFSGFLTSYLLLINLFNGQAFQYLWPDVPVLNQDIQPICFGLIILFLSLFSIKLYHNQPKVVRLLRLVSVLAIAISFVPTSVAHHYQLPSIVVITTLVILVTSYTGIYILRQQLANAWLFNLIWAIFSLVNLSLWLNYYNILTMKFVGPELLNLAVFVLAGFVAFDLITRIRQERSAKEQAKSEASNTLQQYFDIYQNAVEGLFTLSTKGQLISANQQLLTTLGFSTFAQMRNHIQNNGVDAVIGNPKQATDLLQEVLNKKFVASQEVLMLKQDGSHIWGLLTMKLSNTNQQEQSFIHGAVIDITERYQKQQKLAYLASHDPLTGALNRSEFETLLYHALTQVKQHDMAATVLYIDLERFKQINNASGHLAGDSLLRQVTDLLKSVLNEQGSLARFGGDQFTVLLPNIAGNEAFMIAYRIIEKVKQFKFLWEERIFTIGVSIGLKELNSSDTSLNQVFSCADAACYSAKEKGRNRIHVYSDNEQQVSQYRAESQWIEMITDALTNDYFSLYLQTIQPIQTANNPSIGLHYELLLRMRDEQQNVIPPESFIPTAERNNFMMDIDKWVLKSYFRWLSQNPIHLKQLNLCYINLSVASLVDPEFSKYLNQLFITYLIPHDKICFEVSESIAIVNLNATIDFINLFRQQGCKFSLDQFGAGFSSYSYLKTLQIDVVKIEGSFVKDILNDPIDKAMVNSINEVAKAIGITTVAEQVESDNLLSELTKIGIDYAQGYGIDKAKPVASLADEQLSAS